MARRKHRKDPGYELGEQIGRAIAPIILIVLLVILIRTVIWVGDNQGLAIFLFISLIIGILFYYFYLKPRITNFFDTRRLKNATDVISELRYHIDKFSIDIPKGSKHAEALYQIDLGRYLKEKLSSRKVEYEVEVDGKRPDIVIDDATAIEVKSMKDPIDESNRKYNDQHVESVYKKILLYRKSFSKVVFVIFNSDLVKNKKWRAYNEMKEEIVENGCFLIEK